MTVYRVPVRKVFARKKVDRGVEWKDVYGKPRCQKCRQHFRQGEPYTASNDGRKFQHVECS